ncbi:hypothetical protein PHISCL_05072 [Aspergillus sclerotialis]|uniref:EthD domain-containing protein n=1 Tax=Aspergillus sclerotialis TaxID=2070753 RepID=A0A3A2ZTH4_9EURO|nr:hypothetical protein PHISCL_05072 [Aspergillus sclerotialis]
MTFKLILLVGRKPNLTHTQFRNHYETIYIPLLQRLLGDDFPRCYTCTYIGDRVCGGSTECAHDSVSELVFDDAAHFARFWHAYAESGQESNQIAACEEGFVNLLNFAYYVVENAVEAVPLED